MAASTLTGIFAPGSPALTETLRTLVVTPKRMVTPGETIRAEFSFSNLGGAPATGVRVRFALPSGVTHVSGTDAVDDAPLPQGEDFTAAQGAALADLPPNGLRHVACSFRVNDTIEDGTSLEFAAALASDQTAPVASNVEHLIVRSRPMLQNAETQVTIAAPDTPRPGDTITIRATIANRGQSSAHDLLAILPVPEHTRYVARSARVGGRVLLDVRGEPFDYGSETIVAPVLFPGQSVVVEYQAAIETPLADGTRIGVEGAVSANECAEFALRSPEITVSSPVDFENEETALVVHCDDLVTPGTSVPIVLRAVNSGTGAAQNVSIAFELPAGLAYAPGSAHLDGQPVGDDSFPGSTFSLGSIAAGHVVEVGFSAIVAVPAGEEYALPIAATLHWKGASPSIGRLSERRFARRLAVRVAPRFTRARNYIEVDRAVVNAREDLLFTAHAFNDGTSAERSVGLRVIPGAFLENVRVAESPEEPLPYEAPLDLGLVQPHVERTFSIRARVASPVPDRTHVTLGAVLEFDAGSFDLGAGTVVVRSRPRLSAERCAWELQSSDLLRPNHTADVVIRFSNDGSDVLRDARMELELPPELALERAQNARRDGAALLFGDVAAETTHEARLTLRLIRPPKRERTLAVEGSLHGRGISPIHFAPLEIATYAEPEFEQGAELGAMPADQVNAGERVAYELRIRNTGDGPAQRLTLRAVPTNLAVYVPSSTALNGVCVPDDLGVSPLWSQRGLALSDINPGTDVRVRWDMMVVAPLEAGTAIDTRVVLEWDGGKSLALAAPTLRVVSSPSLEASAAGTPISVARAFPALERPERIADTIEDLPVPPPAAVEPEPVALAAEPARPVDETPLTSPVGYVDFTLERLAQAVHTLEKSGGGGLIPHVFAIRMLFPEHLMAAPEPLERSMAEASLAVRLPLDRLFVRLGIPRLTVTGSDLEDRESRLALRGLVAGLLAAPPNTRVAREPETVRLSGPIDVQSLIALAPELETAPLGSVVPWIVAAHLLGTEIAFNGSRSGALGAYRAELLRVLSLLEALPMPEFHRILATSVNHALDEALTAVLEQLRAAARVAVE